ncbi:hypothetical protein A2U01_0083860, partial [Trifolium medium]|nr:hypothetical protein [Trifolium medium]
WKVRVAQESMARRTVYSELTGFLSGIEHMARHAASVFETIKALYGWSRGL